MSMLYTSSRRARAALALVVPTIVTAACSSEPATLSSDPRVESASADLNSGSGYPARQETAGDWAWHSTVSVNLHFDPIPGISFTSELCTGTLIGWNHVLTSSSCAQLGGPFNFRMDVGFFWNGVSDDATTPHRNVIQIYRQQPSGCSSDFAVLELDGPSPRQPPAWLPGDLVSDAFPDNSWVYQVGLGPHDGVSSTKGLMFEHTTHTRGEDFFGGSDYSRAKVLTQESIDGSSDNGGPLYGWVPAALLGHLPSDPTDPVANQPMLLGGVFTGANDGAGFGTHADYETTGGAPSCANARFLHVAMGAMRCRYATGSGTVLDTFPTAEWTDCENVANIRRDASGWMWDTGTCQILGGVVAAGPNPSPTTYMGTKRPSPWCATSSCTLTVDTTATGDFCAGISWPPICGAANQACCTDGRPICADGLGCTNGQCLPPQCGAQNQACCANGGCNSGLVCGANGCVPPPQCGGLNESCCFNRGCAAGIACDVNNKCTITCGQEGLPCCNGASCPGQVNGPVLSCCSHGFGGSGNNTCHATQNGACNP